jgi:23S rRNA pseudouridine1911/1915/1917 synthase
MLPSIIYEDRQLLVVLKPPGWLAQADASDRPDVLSFAKKHVENTRKIPKAYVGLCHRLDRPVGGVMVLAKTSKAAARLSKQFREHTTKKIYLALVTGMVKCSQQMSTRLVREGRLTIKAHADQLSTLCSLNYRVLATGTAQGQEASLLEVTLLTGFKHQIRAQLASIGHPIWGDALYGGPKAIVDSPAIGLFASQLSFQHPIGGQNVTFQASVDSSWPWTAFRPQGVGQL